jgi:hypothetical protein
MRLIPAALAVAAVAAALYAPTAGAQEPGSATVVPIQITGPPSERLNLVILGDGYQADEQDEFRADVDRNLNVQWSIEPFRSYRHYFNVYRLEIVSQDSGISCDPDDGNIRRNTPLRLGFQNTCPAPPLARGITYGPALTPGTGCLALNDPGCTGTQQHNLFLSTYLAPLGVAGQNVQTLALANTFTYGGIGGTQATTSGGSPQGPLISTHELGHSLGQMADEYPYSSRDVVRPCYAGGEPGSFHHTIRTSVDDMIATQFKWWRWIGEESLSGGVIGLWEGGNTFPCGVRRPSQHSMMRWLGFYFDQVGREHMTYRITGRRNANAMTLLHTPLGEVGPDDVVWVETQHPKYHELTVTWRVNGEVVPGNSRNLDLAGLDVSAGDVVDVTVQDLTDFVRDPSFKNGPRMTQTRQWTVGAPLAATPVETALTISTPTDRPVGGDEVVFVETTHPTDRVLDVTWRLDGAVVPNPANSRNFDLEAQNLAAGTHSLSATVTDPAAPGGASQTRSWTVDNVLPTAPRELTEPLTTLSRVEEHNVYFGEFDMGLDPTDDQPGFVVGEFRLNGDGWFNYFGFPEQPEGTPFTFSHSGKDVKALTYGNLGTGGLSKATFEQSFTDAHPSGGFEPGYGTHRVEHRAIDAAGNIGDADHFKATVLPGGSPACTTTLTGTINRRVVVTSGVTCIDGTVNGAVRVQAGASLVVFDGSKINGGLRADDAAVVHIFGASVNGDTVIAGTTGDLIVAGSAFSESLVVSDNQSADVTIPSGETRDYGVGLVGNTIGADLACTGNEPGVTDFGAPNNVAGTTSGQCAAL